jgi:hypothetical protein
MIFWRKTQRKFDMLVTQLIEQFQARTLPIHEWTHEAHLTVAFWHLWQYPKMEALCYLRSGIIAYNVAVGTPNTPSSGYHETITQFWVALISRFLKENRKKSKQENKTFEAILQEFLQSEYAKKEIVLAYYSREKLNSVTARARYLRSQEIHFPRSLKE